MWRQPSIKKNYKMKCCNYGWEHTAAYQGCVVQKQAREVQKYKTINKVSNSETLNKVNEETTNRKKHRISSVMKPSGWKIR